VGARVGPPRHAALSTVVGKDWSLGPLASAFEDFFEDAGPVGHDAVNSKVEQAFHFGRRVDGPHVHREAGPVANTDESGVHDLYEPVPRRDLGGDSIGRNGPEADHLRYEKARYRQSTGAGSQIRPEGLSGPSRPRARERCH
jgi:hypothetical protein